MCRDERYLSKGIGFFFSLTGHSRLFDKHFAFTMLEDVTGLV